MAISRSQPLIVNETPSIATMFQGHVQFDTAPALVHLRALAEEPLSGVRALLAHAVEAKVGALLASHADTVRHGHLPERDHDLHRSSRRALPARARSCWRRLRAHPLFVGDSAVVENLDNSQSSAVHSGA